MVDSGALVERFVRSAEACSASVSVTSAALLSRKVAEMVSGKGPVLVAPQLERLGAELVREGVDARVALREAHEVPLEQSFFEAGAAVTPALTAVASSGSVAVGPSGRNGGLLAALPPHHVVILEERDIVATLAEALALVFGRFPELGGELVFVTGPSRTADIEMMSVLGVHGPLSLDVVVLKEEPR